MARPALSVDAAMSFTKRHAVVIGAGLGGLATALRLSHRGWRVTVCERAGTIGGKMNRWNAAGAVVDTGPSLITMPWAFRALFESVGERLDDHLELMRVEPMARYTFPDGRYLEHSSVLPKWIPVVRDLEGGSAEGWLKFMAFGARLYAVSRAAFFERAPGELPDRSILNAARAMPWRAFVDTMDVVIRRSVRSRELRSLLWRYATYVGSSPFLTPAMMAVIPYLETSYGVWHVRGGLYRVIEVIASLAMNRGTEIRLRTPVVRILHEHGRVQGVETAQGERLAADVVVMNGDASRTAGLLHHVSKPVPLSALSTSGFILLLLVRRRPERLPHHSVYFSADYEREFGDLWERRVFPEDPTVYVNAPSVHDHSMAGDGAEPLFVMANAPAEDAVVWDERMIADARRRVLRRLATGGVRIEEENIAAWEVWTPRRFAETYDMPGGAIYGLAAHGWRQAFLRPPNRVREVRGLYQVGGSTHPGGGTPMVVLSSGIVSRFIGEDMGC